MNEIKLVRPMSEELLEKARQAIARNRQPDDIAEWAEKLADDLVQFTD